MSTQTFLLPLTNSVICIIMLAATFCMMGVCMRNFDKGLRDRSTYYPMHPLPPHHRPDESCSPFPPRLVPGYDFSGSSPMPPFRQRRTHIDADAAADDTEKPTRPGMPSRHGTSSGGGSKANGTETRMSID